MLAAERLVYDYRTADLPPDDRQLCDYAIKLTLTTLAAFLTPSGPSEAVFGQSDVVHFRTPGQALCRKGEGVVGAGLA